MKVLVIIDSMDAGGTQRFLSTLSAGLVERGVDVEIATLTNPDTEDFFELDERVRRHRLSIHRPHAGTRRSKAERDLASLRELRSLVRSTSPDVVLSLGWSTNVIALAATRRLGVPVIVSERSDPRSNPHRNRIWTIAQRALYPFATHLVTQTTGVEHAMRRWVRRGRISTIPNPIGNERFDVVLEPTREPHVVTICRLAQKKGVDTLLRAFREVLQQEPEARLSVVGDGPERQSLEELAVRLGMRDSVTFHGVLDDPAEVARSAWVGCLASRNEGFPNALAEMMAMGLPCVATDCRSGPAELLGDDVGILVQVDDEQSLAAAIVRVLADEQLRRRLCTAARERAHDFDADRVIEQWYRLLCSVV